MSLKKLITSLLFFFTVLSVTSQNLPLNFKVLNDYLRREQVMGNLNNDFSFNVRPIYPSSVFPEFKDSFLKDSLRAYQPKINPLKNKNDKIIVSPLPLKLISVFNSSFPSGWTNGELIPANGFQTLISAGAHVKIGKLSIQLYPQFHYAQNSSFDEYPEEAPKEYFQYLRRSVFYIDQPVRFGNSSIKNFSLGNSHITMNLGPIGFGVSTENIWSGPGQINSLVLSDNAPGFNHFRIQTSRPLKTFLGSFEGNYWIGQLKGSDFTHFSDSSYTNLIDGEKENDWRYFTGITISYSPKWTPGLSLGLTRGFQIYRGDMENTLRSYFPLFAPFQKEGEGLIGNRDKREDQNVSIFSRWSLPSAKSEFYFEYSRNDHPLRWRDFLLNPEHSRAYLLGFSKYVKLPNKYTLGLISEISQTQFSINNIIRWPGQPNNGLGSYDNSQVKHGWTNKGQILGSNTGISGNEQTIKIGLFSDIKEISFKLQRTSKSPNYYHYANTAGLDLSPWVNFNSYFKYSDQIKNLILDTEIGLNNAKNYNYYTPDSWSMGNEKNDKINFNLNISVSFLL